MKIKSTTKKTKIGDQEFLIAPLNMEQIEELMDVDLPPAEDKKAWRARSYQMVLYSLNNAADEGAYALKDVKNMGFPEFRALESAVLELSGLKVQTKGESPAGTIAPSASETFVSA